MPATSITVETYTALQDAYDYFNKALFGGKLPPCLITLPYHRGAYGYFRHEPFSKRTSSKMIKANTAKGKLPNAGKKAVLTDELALNPFLFTGRTDREILSTLVHEQAHLWQHHFGKPKKTHHDKEWATKMEELGLMPSSTGQPGGRRTGRRVSHYIIDGGAYDLAQKKCKITINWAGMMRGDEGKKSRKRTKYCCPECETNLYGKAELSIICGSCSTPRNPVYFEEA